MKVETKQSLMKISHLALILGTSILTAASAATIAIPNGDFSLGANNGSIQGSILSGGATAGPLGSGPWNGKTSGLVSVLLPPTASIGSGHASVTGLLGLGALGQSNTAQFYQTISGLAFQPGTTYTLSATVDSGMSLSLGLLGHNGIGLALTRGGNVNVVADSATASAGLVTLVPLGGTAYRLGLQYLSPASPPAGDLGIRLYAGFNADLATASLLQNVTFDSVTLTAVPEPSSTALFTAGLALLAVVAVRRKRALGPLALVAAMAMAAPSARASLPTTDIPLNITLAPNASYTITADVNVTLAGALLGLLSANDDPLEILNGDGNVIGLVPVQDLIDLLTGASGAVTHQIEMVLTAGGQEIINPVVRVLDSPLIQVTNPTIAPTTGDKRPGIAVVARNRAGSYLRLRGRAKDDHQVARIEVVMNGHRRPVAGRDKWTSKLKLRTGRNFIRVRSFDDAGQASAPKRFKVTQKN